MMPPIVRIGNWNVQRAGEKPSKAPRVKQILADLQADVLCITEGTAELLPPGGHVITSRDEYGYEELPADSRMVLLWSPSPWHDVDDLGHSDLPGGQFISGVTASPVGDLRVVGICIPWHFAHVSTGRRDRELWQDHRSFLAGLRQVLPQIAQAGPTVVVGDYNQFVPHAWAPRDVFEELWTTFEGWKIATQGCVAGIDAPVIDHVAHTPDLIARKVWSWGRRDPTGAELSDHDGVLVKLGPSTSPGRSSLGL